MTGINSAAAALREVWSALALHGRELAERAADRLRSERDHHHPHFARPRTQNTGVPAVRPNVADPPELPLFRQPFTGASSLVTLTL